jgi:Haloacid dehalogenase-like hydrolase
MIKCVIFDHTTVRLNNTKQALLTELNTLMEQLKDRDIKIVVLSTETLDINQEMMQRGLPAPDAFFCKNDIGANKGSPLWVEKPAQHFGIEIFEILYVGDDELDWRSAINAGAMFLLAMWAYKRRPGALTAIPVDKPEDIWLFISHFLMLPPRWEYTLDDPNHRLIFRSLLSTQHRFPGNPPHDNFQLLDVFYKKLQVTVGPENQTARSLFLLHALSSVWLEGLLPSRSVIGIYPSHTPGKLNEIMQEYIEPASRAFKSYFKEDLLVRGAASLDTSLERGSGRRASVTFNVQTNSVHVNPNYRNLIQGHNVLVFDEFTTSGMSLEWARNLLLKAGAARVILVTVGKYGFPPVRHTVFTPVPGVVIEPYQLKTYGQQDFSAVSVPLKKSAVAAKVVIESFKAINENRPFSL